MSFDYLGQRALDSIRNTLRFQNEAINNLYQHYDQQDSFTSTNFLKSIETLYNCIHSSQGKIIVCGIGKSYKIANKLVATLQSLSIQSALLHPSEALHGDLGMIDQSKDCIIMITASGNTPELINLLPHISNVVPIVLLTCNESSILANHNQVSSLLLVNLPSHLNEDSIHGLPAPTVSTSLSLILADSTILALSELLEDDLIKRRKLFSKKHPGGNIGSKLTQEFDNNTEKSSTISLLSLGQQISQSASLSSDDESNIYINQITPTPIAPTKPRMKSLTHDEVINIQELTLLKYITLYEYLTIEQTQLIIACNKVRQLYQEYDQQNKDWNIFKWDLMRGFS
ncbi:putative phosphosugar isomerase [Spathaspora sp. JA1]|nr:putative phosphosugar isomerase [Spathaspora sp. JA1]